MTYQPWLYSRASDLPESASLHGAVMQLAHAEGLAVGQLHTEQDSPSFWGVYHGEALVGTVQLT